MATEKRWLTVDEAGEVYSLHPTTVYKLCKERRIPWVRIPSLRNGRGMVRIDRRRMDELLEREEIDIRNIRGVSHHDLGIDGAQLRRPMGFSNTNKISRRSF
jgi:excisionase family DNA binding protein